MELLEVLTVGLPFCGFKMLAGLSQKGPGGLLFVGLGVVDAVINAVNLTGLLVVGRRPLAACALALVAGAFRRRSDPISKWRDFGSSSDVLLSFALVALMIGLGRLTAMSSPQLTAWNVCVILNVLGAGLGRFGASLRDISRAD
jgi:hypothetical protein